MYQNTNTDSKYKPVIIAHRGLIDGPDLFVENKQKTIEKAISLGFMVECDVRWVEDSFYLGHDYPDQPLSLDFILINAKQLVLHCKNYEALVELIKLNRGHSVGPDFFWHCSDSYTLTWKGLIWAYPEEQVSHTDTVCLLPELETDMLAYLKQHKPAYVCTKYANKLKEFYYGQ